MAPDERDETLEFKRKAYRLLFIRPCMSDRTKKMAEAQLRPGLTGKLADLRLPGYQHDYSGELGLARLTRGKKSVLVFRTGALSIRNAEDEQDVVATVGQVLRALKNSQTPPPPNKKTGFPAGTGTEGA